MSFYAWSPKAPRGFGRVVGYTAGLGYTLPGVSLPPPGPTSSGLTTQASMQVNYATADSRVIVRAPGSPMPVDPSRMATQVAASAPTLGPQYATSSGVIDQIARAGERVADQSMQAGMDATASSGQSQTDAIIPTPSAGSDLVAPPEGFLSDRGLPWWVYFGGGALGGVLLGVLLGR